MADGRLPEILRDVFRRSGGFVPGTGGHDAQHDGGDEEAQRRQNRRQAAIAAAAGLLAEGEGKDAAQAFP